MASRAAANKGNCTVGDLAGKLWGAGSGYDKHTRPNWAINGSAAAPVDQVETSLQFLSLADIDSKAQVMTLIVYLRMRWYDRRLRYNPGKCFHKPRLGRAEVGFAGDELRNIWTPGVEIANSKESEELYSCFWLYSDGQVWVTKKLILDITCEMDFRHFPYDVQHCPLFLFSWRDLSYDLKLNFFKGAPGPVGMTEGHRGSIEWEHPTITPSAEVDASRLGFTWGAMGLAWRFDVERVSAYYEKTIMLPNTIMVFIAWLSFFVSRNGVPARVAMTIICFLAIMGQVSSVNSSIPRFSGRVWLLDYLFCSLLFVTYSIVEYAAANFLMRIELRSKQSLGTLGAEKRASKAAGRLGRCLVRPDGRLRVYAHHLDIASRYAFPAAFALAVVVQRSTLAASSGRRAG